MARSKRHLVVAVKGAVRAACGVVDPRFTTPVPSEVTCVGCQRTVAMADAEIAARKTSSF